MCNYIDNCFEGYEDYKKFLTEVEALKVFGKTESEIALHFGLGIPQLRKMKAMAYGEKYKNMKEHITKLLSCKEPTFSIKEISEIMGIPEAIIRNISKDE
ncbi:hypothetical protein [Pseudobutyrivibrio sp.]